MRTHSAVRPNLRVRLSAEMLELLKKASQENGRTLTGEIAARLELSFVPYNQQEMISRMVTETINQLRPSLSQQLNGGSSSWNVNALSGFNMRMRDSYG